MKQYVIDELRPADHGSVKAYLNENYGPDQMDGIFSIPIDPELLSDIQKAHRDCQPHYFAVDLDENRIACELLVRSKNIIRCDCISYATESQRNWLIDMIDHMFNQLEILT